MERAIERIPLLFKVVLGLITALAAIFAGAALVGAVRARRLARERARLRRELGLLQEALNPAIPDRIGALRLSIAYRPADGLAAGGDFYDAFPCREQCVGVVIGDVSGHGTNALSSTTLVRHTVRAYIEGGLDPRQALKLASAVLSGALDDRFVTVLAAVYDPADATLQYAAAAHPHPILLGPVAHEPVTVMSSPPLGLDLPTGTRQTTVPFPAGGRAVLYTDGLIEAPTQSGLLGTAGLTRGVRSLRKTASAAAVLGCVEQLATRVRDDMAACVVSATSGDAAGDDVIEEIEVSEQELDRGELEPFLKACGVPEGARTEGCARAKRAATMSGVALVRVTRRPSGALVEAVPGELSAVGPRVPV